MTDVVYLKKTEPSRESTPLFETIAADIRDKGYSINFNALPADLGESLWLHMKNMNLEKYSPAGVGRKNSYNLNTFIRSDEICWINGDSEAGKAWLEWTKALQLYLNSRLFLGLFSFESHFSHYPPGAFYKKHVDAFRGESNRVLSMILYLNPGWLPDDGGQLELHLSDDQKIRVTPNYGTLVTFLSEEFPHEVLSTKRDRYSIAGWFRVNGSTLDKVDPPS
jgi:SM-20-related protein